ncbi:MAG: ribonuclease III domain-containing protein [Eubacteriales bacterium]|nr:ribonuclease III domain-containing protein [Eubacteriales bacterium]
MGESIEFLQYLDERMQLPETDMREMSPLVLAYIGDAAYELVIRTMLVKTSHAQVERLHRRASARVKASAQAAMIAHLLPMLTEEEERAYKRGRNAKSYTKAKNATMSDYRKATGFEALIGYLYLKKETTRMVDLIREGLDAVFPEEAQQMPQEVSEAETAAETGIRAAENGEEV